MLRNDIVNNLGKILKRSLVTANTTYNLKFLVIGLFGTTLASFLEQIYGDSIFSTLKSVFAWTTILVFSVDSMILIMDAFQKLLTKLLDCIFLVIIKFKKKKQALRSVTVKKDVKKRVTPTSRQARYEVTLNS